jgi:succinate dehydrogenase hydrophobic anchor subunit
MRESSLWFWHIFAGLVILVLLGIHMFIMHLDAILAALGAPLKNPIDATSVFERSRQAVFMITYILLLGAALYHGLYGLKNILFELTLPKALEKVTAWLLTIAGVLLFAYGTYVAVFVFMTKEI